MYGSTCPQKITFHKKNKEYLYQKDIYLIVINIYLLTCFLTFTICESLCLVFRILYYKSKVQPPIYLGKKNT